MQNAIVRLISQSRVDVMSLLRMLWSTLTILVILRLRAMREILKNKINQRAL